MKKLIDDKGRIFGKINVIDFLALLIILGVIPAFYTGQKLLREFCDGVELYDRQKYSPTYGVTRKCPNCGVSIKIQIKKGLPAKDFFPYKITCPNCENEVTLKFEDD